MNEPALILIMSDDAGLAERLQPQLTGTGCRTVHLRTGAEALAWLHDQRPELMLLDDGLPDMSARELLANLDRRGRIPPFLVISGNTDVAVAVAIMKEGARDYLVKDARLSEALATAVPRLLRKLDTEQRLAAAERALQQRQNRDMALLEAIPDTLVRLAPDGIILDYRPGHQPSRPLVPSSRSPQHLRDVLPVDTAAALLRAAAQLLRTGHAAAPLEFPLPGPAGVFEARLAAASDREVVLVIRDITERARLERMKTDFVDRAAHELRTPLATIGLMVDLLEQGGTEEETQQFWDVLRAELVRQQVLVNELLAAGRLEEGKLDLRATPVALTDVLDHALQTMAPLLRAGQLQVHCDCAPELPPVKGDKVYLHQVIMNLLNNAAKFTLAGGAITVRAWEAVPHQVACSIEDTGIGIPAGEVARLGERFFRASNAVHNEIPGTGTGLYIVYSIVARHGGHIQCESQLGHGTRMTVFLPAAERQ